MGKVTALKPQSRNPERVNVFLDNEFAFGLSRIVAAWLRIGQNLTTEKISSLQAQDNQEIAYQQALNFISYRPRSEAEVIKKLLNKSVDETVIQNVLDRLRKAKLVGDDQFAREWIDNRSTFRPRSYRMLRFELKQKGVEEVTINQALQDAVDEPELAYQAGCQYARRLSNSDWETFRKRLGGFLIRRGFSYGTALPVIRRIWEEHQSEEQ